MFHSITFQTFCLATEDAGRVKEAILFLVGDPGIRPKEERMLGHHKNPITTYTIFIKRASAIDAFFKRLAQAGLGAMLLGQLEDRLDEDLFLNLRFNKQEAYRGRIVLACAEPEGGSITARAKVKAYPSSREAALGSLSEFFGRCAQDPGAASIQKD